MDQNQIIRNIITINEKINKINKFLESNGVPISSNDTTNNVDEQKINKSLQDMNKRIDNLETIIKNNFNTFNEKINNNLNNHISLKNEFDQFKSIKNVSNIDNTSIQQQIDVIQQMLNNKQNNDSIFEEWKKTFMNDFNKVKTDLADIKNISNPNEIETMIKQNFQATNDKFDKVNESVTTLNTTISKFNDIEQKVITNKTQIDGMIHTIKNYVDPLNKRISQLEKLSKS